MEDRDNEVLALIQTGFPLESHPFRIIGERIGRSGDEIIETVRSLIANRVIREFGPVFDARRLGYVSTLVAVQVDPDRAAELAASMLAIPEITHNYYRDAELNLWFTITARNRDTLDDIIRWVRKQAGISQALDLPVEKFFKLRAVFGAAETPNVPPRSGRNTASHPGRAGTPAEFGEEERKIIRVLQQGLPVVERPYLLLAEEAGTNEDDIIGRLRGWTASGVIRRFGARLDHRRAGYTVNALAAWKGKKLSEWGNAFAAFPQVSHCYLRQNHPEWPYSLYTMIHATNEDELAETVASMRRIAPEADVAVMRTLYELKKTSMKYFLEK